MAALPVYSESIVWQEVPNEVSLAFLIAGCPLRCKGCHSTASWSGRGAALDAQGLQQRMDQYQGLITCVLFMGGEWQADDLCVLLKIARDAGLATCLYTGFEYEDVPPRLLAQLTYLKTGRFRAELGGLDSPTTNQRFIDLRTGAILNPLFQKGRHHDPLKSRAA